jgi:hypothetical protein
MRIIIGSAGLGLGLVMFFAAACGRGEVRGPEVATTTSVQLVGNEDAVQRITGARCEREYLCNKIGPGKSYETREACMNELGHNKRADLGAEECGRGISEPDLQDCLHDIHEEKCENPLDAISRLAACRKGKLCVSR